jgi:hypothetical protein
MVKKIEMKLSDFIKEHKHLISLLKKSSDPKIKKEAKSQEKEMKSVVKKYK